MEDFGDYLYFILLIVFSLVGLLKKKEAVKPVHETSEDEEEYNERDIVIFPPVDDWENTQSEPETVPPIIDWPVFTKPETKTPKTVFEGITDSYETATDFTKIKARTNVKPVKTEVKKQSFNFEELSDTDAQDYTIETVEDARRAIILSEIIHRKY
jgi:hypothetical protein